MTKNLKKLKVITDPNPILREKSKEIDILNIDKKVKELNQNMIATLTSLKGAGLAAPQVGKNIRLIIVHTKDGYLSMMNPRITQKSKDKEVGEEGCFSVVDDNGKIIFGNVLRFKEIKCEYYDESVNKIQIEAKGLFARVIQHEIDHLDGVLFIDKLES